MPSYITANRPGVDERFPLAGFTIRTGMSPSWFEAVFTTRKELLQSEMKSQRNANNFFSTRGMGALPAPRGEAVFIVPPEVMARFAGNDRLFYSMATYRSPDFSDPDLARLPPESLPSVVISPSFSGRQRRSMIGSKGGSLTGHRYTNNGAASLTWAGDMAAPGKMEPVQAPRSNGNGNGSRSAPSNGAGAAAPPSGGAAQSQAYATPYSDGYDDSLWAKLQETEEDSNYGIEGPIPDSPELTPAQAATFQAAPEYPQASRFVPAASSNYRARTSARTINRVVIHITDGGSRIGGTIGWFQNPQAKVSAHYIVGQDGEVVQMVRHNDVAWHARSANGDSIGIEHVANTRGLRPTAQQYCASAALVNWLCAQYNIPMDRQHVLGHSEADPGTTHTGCPNAVWDWNYYMGMVTSGSCYEPATQSLTAAAGASGGYRTPVAATRRKAGAAALSSGSFDVYWADVPLIPQMTDMSCWAAAAAMVVGWRERMEVDPSEIARGAGRWAAYQQGLNPADVPALANAWGLVMESPQSYGIDAFRQMIETKGPLWVGAAVPTLHAIVVAGVYGDGTPDGTYVRIKDPWGRSPGSTPGSPAPYNPTPGQGSQYELTFRQFVQEYEGAAVNYSQVNIQILHSGGTGGRMAGTSAAQAFSAPGGRQRVVRAADGGVGVAVAVGTFLIDKVISNSGDVNWKLDQARGKKHVDDNAANEGSGVYRDQSVICQGPHAWLGGGLDHIYFDAEVRFQYNGRSIANISVFPNQTNDALGAGLDVEAKIQDDNRVYLDNQRNRIAGMKVYITYRFTFTIGDDYLYDGVCSIYGDGDSRWTWTRRQ